MRMSDLNGETFTLIIQIPASQTSASKKAWRKTTLMHCGKIDGLYDRSAGTMAFRANTWTAYIRDWEQYRPPLWTGDGYYALPEAEQGLYFTANVGDLLIFADVPDPAPATLSEFSALCDKYRGSGGAITGVEAHIRYKPDGTPWATNHIALIKG